ncbi:FAD-binding oxidoreductase [Aliiglaciecola sp. LCG003]|uniref:FAD-binding oxidoreductase n=1 Tax=Aliiglaciecola sp. LCG003 TaxID=3053655 RepID=UPI00257406E2|nr:FAD-binding oxidoreductase [Aliiglaciecola sp. LCG003]WJG09822.1 FAD-binding oxidoreductase [Aliiglaciecola sp. LCG003]
MNSLWQYFCMMVGNQPKLAQYFEPIIKVISPSYHGGLTTCRVISVTPSGNQMLTLNLKMSCRWKGFTPGQYVQVTLQKDGRYIRRPFSISSGLPLWTNKRQIQISCKINSDGQLTPHLTHLLKGDFLHVSQARGEFLSRVGDLSILLVAAGSGITPLRSYLQSRYSEEYQDSQDSFP